MFRQPSAWLLAALLLTGCTDQPATTEPLVAATAPAAQPATARYAGEYRWSPAAAEAAGGIPTVYPESDATLLFQVDANDGPPAYHLVNVLG